MSPPDRALRGVGTVVVLGSMMSVLDVTIANVALNPLSKDLHATLATVQWVSTAYTLALAGVIPASAWAMQRFGARRVYLTCLLLFSAGSALAAAAPSVQALIACRVLQGAGGGMLIPTGMALVFSTAGPTRLGLASRILGVPLLVAPLLGPVAGGVLVDAVSWRALFAINLPLGLLAAALGLRLLPAGEPQRGRGLDGIALAMLSPALALVIFGVTRVGAHGLTLLPVAFVGAGVILGLGFVRRTVGSPMPLIDLRLLRRRSVGSAIATATVFAGGYFGVMFLAPLYFQLVRGESVAASGLLIAPWGICSALTMQVAGKLLDRVGGARIVRCGLPVAIVGLGAFVLQLSPTVAYWRLDLALAVMGVGVGGTLMPATAAANADLEAGETPSASTMLQVSSQLAAALGTAVAAVVFAAALTAHVPGAPSGGGLGYLQHLPAEQLRAAAGSVVTAFRLTYLVGLSAFALALVPAALMPAPARIRRPTTDGEPIVAR